MKKFLKQSLVFATMNFMIANIALSNNNELDIFENDGTYEDTNEINDFSDKIPGNKATNFTQDITGVVRDKMSRVDDDFESVCLGNSCSGSMTSAKIEFNSVNDVGVITVYGRLHNKHQHCVDKPWPASGEWCVDTYNYWVNITVKAHVVNCKVITVIATSSNTLYAIPAAFGSLIVGSVAPYGFVLNATRFC